MSKHPLPTSTEIESELRKVLIVDDETEVRDVVAVRIENYGRHRVLKAEGLEDALDIVKHDVDILAAFVDQRISGDERGGLKILKEILKQRPLLPVILYTGAPGADIRREAYDAGALWYLPKVQIAGTDDLIWLLEIAARLVDVMPPDIDHRFLKQILDAVPTQVMVRDRLGCVIYQNKAKEEEFGPIVAEQSFCWHQYEGHDNSLPCRCPTAKADCACELVFSQSAEIDRSKPVKRIYRYPGNWERAGRHHYPGWIDIGATAILGRDGLPQYAVEVAHDITQLVETLRLITDLARQHDLSEEDTLLHTCRSLVGTVRFARARIWKCDRQAGDIVCSAAEGAHKDQVIGKRLPLPAEILSRLANREPIQVSKEEILRFLPQEVLNAIDVPADCLLAPFYDGSELAGIVAIDRKDQESQSISQLDKYWTGFVGQALSALVELKRRRGDIEWLRELLRKLSGIDSVSQVARIAIDDLQKRVNANLIQFHQVDSDNGVICLTVDNHQHSDQCPARKGYPATIGVNARACREDRPIFLNDTEQDEDFLTFRRELTATWGDVCRGCELRPASMGCVPIHMGEKVVGSLCLSYTQAHVFSEREQDLLLRVCDSLSIALKATQRLTVMQSQAMEVRRVQGVQVISRGLTHELRNIAQSIMGDCSNISRAAANSQDVSEGAAAISRQVESMNRLFEALGRHAAVQTKDLRTAINQSIEDIVTLQSRRFRDHGVVLTARLDRACDAVRKNQDKFLVILLTVLENAFRAVTEKKEGTPPRTVEITTLKQEGGNRVFVVVRDSGIGIAADRIGQLLAWPTSDAWGMPPAHGIGLPIARNLAVSMGGDIRIESKLNVGTTVTVDLPSDSVLEERND